MERQGEIIEAWAASNGHEVVGWADDVDFSRGTMPFEAPGFSPWLTDPEKIAQYDIIAVWKLDRLGAGSIILNAVLSWGQDHGKTIVSATESLDFSTWVGRLVANVIAGVAEGEWEAIKERTAGSQAKLRQLRRWHGGTPPFGYRAESLKPEPGYALALVREEADLINWMADQVIEGHSVNGLVDVLNEKGLPPRRGGSWTAIGITRILRSRWVLGQKTYKGALILEDDGMPAQFARPVFASEDDEATPDYRKWQAVQTALDNRKVQKKRSHGTSLLLNVATCDCGAWLYRWVVHRRGKDFVYYRCSGRIKRQTDCKRPGIKADQLEAFAEQMFLDDLGDYERTEKFFVEGTSNADERHRTELAIESLRKERDLGLYEDDDEGYFSRLTVLVNRKKALEAQPIVEPHWEERGLGETYRQAWERKTDEERREMLLDHGIQITATANPFQASYFCPVDVVRKKLPGFRPEIGDRENP